MTCYSQDFTACGRWIKFSCHLSGHQSLFSHFPQNPQVWREFEPPLPFSIPVMTDGCFHVAVAKSFLLLCSASISHQVAPHSPYKLKGKRSPCLSLLSLSYLLRECFIATVTIWRSLQFLTVLWGVFQPFCQFIINLRVRTTDTKNRSIGRYSSLISSIAQT